MSSLIDQLLPHQRDGVDHILQQGAVLLADDPGLGKTLTMLATAESESLFPLLLVTKASLAEELRGEVQRWLPDKKPLILKGKKGIENDVDVVIVSYHGTANRTDDLCAIRWEMVAADESHYLKNPDAVWSKAFDRIVRAADPQVLVLASATPAVSRPVELLNQLTLLDRLDDVASSKDAYLDRYCDRKLVITPRFNKRTRKYEAYYLDKNGKKVFFKIWDSSGNSNVEELFNKLTSSGLMLRRKKDNVVDLPDCEVLIEELPDRGWEEYTAAETRFVDWLASIEGVDPDEIETSPSAKMAELRWLTAQRKIDHVVENFNPAELGPIVLMSFYRDTVLELHDRLEQQGYRVAKIIGGMTSNQRVKAKTAFQNGELDFITCSIEAAAEGLTLTRSNRLVFVELPWVPGRFEQAMNRIHRIGQTKTCYVHVLLCEDTVDVDIWNPLCDKSEVTKAMFDGIFPAGDDEKKAESTAFGAVLAALKAQYS